MTKKQTGRPSDYKEEYCDQMIEYFKSADPYEISVSEDGRVTTIPGKFPSFSRFALSIGTYRHRLNEWAKKHPEFREAKMVCRDYQEAFLSEAGMVGAVDRTFAIFAAKNIIGWSDKGRADYVEFRLPKNKTPIQQANYVLEAISNGDISVTVGNSIIASISSLIKIEEVTEIKERLEALEKATDVK